MTTAVVWGLTPWSGIYFSGALVLVSLTFGCVICGAGCDLKQPPVVFALGTVGRGSDTGQVQPLPMTDWRYLVRIPM